MITLGELQNTTVNTVGWPLTPEDSELEAMFTSDTAADA